MLLYQHCDIFPKMHIVSIQIGDVFIGVHRKLHERREFGQVFWPRPQRLHGWSSWLLKLLFFSRLLAGKHVSSQAATQGSPSQYGCPAEEPIEGRDPPPQISIRAKIPKPAGCTKLSLSRKGLTRRHLPGHTRHNHGDDWLNSHALIRNEWRLCVEEHRGHLHKLVFASLGGSPLSQHVILDGGSFAARKASDTRMNTKTPHSECQCSSCEPSPSVKK